MRKIRMIGRSTGSRIEAGVPYLDRVCPTGNSCGGATEALSNSIGRGENGSEQRMVVMLVNE